MTKGYKFRGIGSEPLIKDGFFTGFANYIFRNKGQTLIHYNLLIYIKEIVFLHIVISYVTYTLYTCFNYSIKFPLYLSPSHLMCIYIIFMILFFK